MTITVLQGRGTAIYTPLEQYGGDTGHTDSRSDIYAFGATLYHLLTNQQPIEARERFLHPYSLTPIRQINPNVSFRTERAIMWAMSLHPDDRPQDVETFKQALFGSLSPITQPNPRYPSPTFEEVISSPLERILVIAIAVILLLSFIATVVN
jgi:eukaryotic-like serine/threonine-protein kinase